MTHALSRADKEKPYAHTEAEHYADPGYQPDGKKRYALDTEDEVRAAWSYINQADNAAKYTSEQLAAVKSRIKAAGKKYGIEYADEPARSRRPARVTAGPQYIRAYTSADDDWTREAPGSPVPMTASTPGMKRDGMDLRANGWRVDNYHRAGGPVLWQHDHTRPSLGNGRARAEPNRLHMNVTFDQEDEFARQIESKLRRRVLRASSVGWDFTDGDGRVIEHHRMSAERLARTAYYDLSELSIVNVPADPSAVAERHWRALRSLHPSFADLFRAQERTDSDVTGPQIRAAVLDLCQRLGIGIDRADGGQLLRAHDIEPPTSIPAAAGETAPPTSTSVAVDERAARVLLAAFNAL